MAKETYVKSHNEDISAAREKIMQAAVKLFAVNGLDGTSTRDIAKGSGLNISLISYYFGGKVGLYKTVIREHMQSFKDQADLVMSKVSPDNLTAEVFIQEIGNAIDVILEKRKTDKCMMMIMMRERLEGLPHARELHEEIIAPSAEKLVHLIRMAQENSIVKKDINPYTFFSLLVESIWGFISVSECGLSLHKQAHKVKKNTEEFKSAVMDIFLKGILK